MDDNAREDKQSSFMVSSGNSDEETAVSHNTKDSPHKPMALKPYAGMNKEDLLRFSQTPFWVRLRLACLVIFWLSWVGLMVAIVTLTIILPRCQVAPSNSWWQRSAYYQVYVRSYSDSDGSGSGDLNGLTQKLDYIRDLNVEVIMIGSVADSAPDGDFGYDVINHTAVHPELGTLEDFGELITAAHERYLKIILDFVPNYTGKSHQWFVESRRTANASVNAYYNYYTWRDCGVNGTKPPNNWRSMEDQSAWQYDDVRGQCYLTQFLGGQPQVNLRSNQVRAELQEVLKFWLRLGIDGFRVREADFLFEDHDLRDDLYNATCGDATKYECYDHIHTRNQPEIHDILPKWRAVVERFSRTGDQRVLITDADTTDSETYKYYGQFGARGAHFPLYYGLRHLQPKTSGRQIEEQVVRPWLQRIAEKATGGWLLDDQDGSRVTSLLGSEYAHALVVLTMTLPGVPLFYYGDELGMLNGQVTGVDPRTNSRDPFRSPMQWTPDTNAGFTNDTVQPYLPIQINSTTLNVQVEEEQQDSSLKLFRSLAQLRKDDAAMQYGHIHFHTDPDRDSTLAFIREFDGTNRYLVIVNLGDQPVTASYLDMFGSGVEMPDSAVVVVRSGAFYAVGESVQLNSVTVPALQAVLLQWPYSR